MTKVNDVNDTLETITIASHLLIVFVADLKSFFDDVQRVGELALVLTVENGGGDFRSQISRLESPILKRRRYIVR